MNDDSPLNDDERDRLRRAREDVAPPRALEERTVAALRERGMIRRPARQLAAVMSLAAAAVLIVIGAIGVLIAGLVIFLWYRKRSLRHLEVNFPKKDGPVSP